MLTKIALLSLLATLVAGDQSRGYMLVYQKGYCGNLGHDLRRDIYDPAECFRLAQESGATAFSMGRKYILEG